MGDKPVQIQELFQLTALGVNPQSITFNNVTMESDKFICVREQLGDAKHINIIETATQGKTINRVNADSAIMNPMTKVLALRASNKLQVYNLEMRSKISEHTMNDTILFWKWITPKTIAIVTSSSVFHWNIDGNQSPVKAFDRNPKLEGATIINYRTDRAQKWLLLCGLVRDQDGMRGVMQLYSVEKQVTQVIDGHAAAFVEFPISPSYTTTLICIASNSASGGGKLYVMEVPQSNKPQNVPAFQRQIVPMQYADPSDFAIAMQASDKHGVVYIITKSGLLYVYEVETASLLYQTRVSQDTIFITAPYSSTSGLIGVTRSGRVVVISIDEQTVIPYITNTLNNTNLAVKIASRANLSGADGLYLSQFDSLLQTNQVQQAIELAANSPQGILRTPQTIQKLQRMPAPPGGRPPISAYFQYIMERSKLNPVESIELAKIVLSKPGGSDYLKQLITEDKIECSEDLGDMVRSVSGDLAMTIYLKGGAHDKIVDSLIMRGDHERILQYCEKVQYQPNHTDVFRKLCTVNPDAAVKYAIRVHEKGEPIDPNFVVDTFTQGRLIKNATAYLLEILKDDKPEDGPLQTKLLEINLLFSPITVADSILAQNYITLSHYDRYKVAQLCEKAGLFQRALENYSDLSDIKRVLMNTQFLDIEWLVEYFGNLDADEVMSCARELLKNNPIQNLSIVVQVAQRYSNELTPEALIRLFEEFRSFQGLFFYLGHIVDTSDDPDVHFKYIEAAVRTGKYSEVERITRESDYYDPERTKEFLKEMKLQDPMPFINVCDKYDFVEEMVHYFYNNQMLKYIDTYVKQHNPLRTPTVVGALIDVDASEDFIRNLIMSVGSLCPIEPLVNEVEKRNRLKLLRKFLEMQINEGNQEPAAHNALAKIYIDLNHDAELFLTTNEFYDSRVVGKYCEKRDPYLAFVAYKRGQCDFELVDVTNKNGMFKQQARYLVQRQSPELWAHVLVDDNEHRRSLIDQVVQTALPESNSPEEVSSAVKAFMTADLPNELIELLEQIVLRGNSDFKQNKNLQNLLILTAIKADTSRVMDYVTRLDNYDAADIANIAVEKDLFEEAFAIYSKFEMHTDAMRVLIDHICSIDRAAEYAEMALQPDVWSLLGHAQLGAGLVPEAIDSFLKADDPSPYHEVIAAAENSEHFESLITFLRMARKTLHDSHIDTELVYSYARLAKQDPASNSLADMEEFITSPNSAQIQSVGDRCFDEGLYEAARILFSSISNYSRLASTLVKLGKNREAVSAATKANNVRTWKEVMEACVDAGEFKYAQTCGLNIIVHADELDELVHYYEVRGHYEELIALLEKGLGLEQAHMGIFTQLGCMYAKYRPEAVMEHITRHWKRCHIPRLIRACESNYLWAEACFLYAHHDEYDNAVRVMIDHPAEAFDHTIFTETVVKVVNVELFYRSIDFYLDYSPENLVDLLSVLTPKLDHARVAKQVQDAGELPLIKKYLEAVQDANILQVNEALNSLYIEEEDFKSLRVSIDSHNNIDHIALAKQLENHELLEFRRVAALLYKLKKQWASSIELSKKDNLHQDAMETAAESREQSIAEDLLKFFVDNGLKDCFAACLYNCYSLIRPDVAMEYAWRHKIQDMAMPYFMQVMREYTNKVDEMHKDHKRRKARKDKKKKEKQRVIDSATDAVITAQMTGMHPQMTGMMHPQLTGMMHPQMTGMIHPQMTGMYRPQMTGMSGGYPAQNRNPSPSSGSDSSSPFF